jgi:hypothetical protein
MEASGGVGIIFMYHPSIQLTTSLLSNRDLPILLPLGNLGCVFLKIYLCSY